MNGDPFFGLGDIVFAPEVAPEPEHLPALDVADAAGELFDPTFGLGEPPDADSRARDSDKPTLEEMVAEAERSHAGGRVPHSPASPRAHRADDPAGRGGARHEASARQTLSPEYRRGMRAACAGRRLDNPAALGVEFLRGYLHGRADVLRRGGRAPAATPTAGPRQSPGAESHEI